MIPAVYRLLALRYVLHRWDRAALIVVSIALGVATLVSARILNQCVEAAAQDTTTPVAGADLYVTNGEAGVLRSLADELRAAGVPGVRSVQPIVYDRVSLPQLDGRVAVLIGVEVSSQLIKPDNELKVEIEWKRQGPVFQFIPLFAAAREGEFGRVGELWSRIPGRLVLVTEPIYQEWERQAGPGKPLVLRHAGRDTACLPIGVVKFGKDSPLAPLGANFVGMEVGQASKVIRPSSSSLSSTPQANAPCAPPPCNARLIFLPFGAAT